jgi:hypothetical protein
MKSRVLMLPLLLTFASCGLFRSVIEKNLEVAPQTVRCAFSVGGLYIPIDPNLATLDCLQVRFKSTDPWFPNEIQGFTHQAGFQYLLRVRVIGPQPGLMDDHGHIEFVSIISKTPAAN